MPSGTLYVPLAGDDVWANFLAAVFSAVVQGYFRDEVGANATGALTTNATFATATTFTVAGDLTTVYTADRRIRVVHAGGTSYCRVLSSSFASPNTTVTIGNVTSGPTTMTTPITSVALALDFAGNGGAGNVPSVGDFSMLRIWGL